VPLAKRTNAARVFFITTIFSITGKALAFMWKNISAGVNRVTMLFSASRELI
jgi:hypothetical protein